MNLSALQTLLAVAECQHRLERLSLSVEPA